MCERRDRITRRSRGGPRPCSLAYAAVIGCALGVAAAPPALGAEALPVRFRGETWAEAAAELTARTGLPIVASPAGGAGAPGGTIWLTAEALDADSAIRWTARLAGAAAIRVGDRYVVGRLDAWPVAWRARWARIGADAARRDEERRAALAERRTDIVWLDQTLGGVEAEVRRTWGIDLIFDPAVRARQELVTLSAPQIGWDDFAERLGRALHARVELLDRAAVVGESAWLDALAGRPATRDAAAGSGDPPGQSPPARWETWIRLDTAEPSWEESLPPILRLADDSMLVRIEEATGEDAGGRRVEAAGPVGAVSEALRILGFAGRGPLRARSQAEVPDRP